MPTMTADEDLEQQLPHARTQLNRALSDLIAAYQQLEATEPPPNAGRATPKSRPPMQLDTLSLTREIDAEVRQWNPHLNGTTLWRLHNLLAQKWRPQDVQHLNDLTARADHYTQRIDKLLNPHNWHITAKCPVCQAERITRNRNPNEPGIRQPALQITEHGCQCQNCGTLWTPDYYVHLARVLECPLPEGVLE